MLTSGPFRPASDVSKLLLEKDPWLVPGIIPLASVVVLASSPKAGKTCFATALARAVAKGESFLGQEVVQTPVLWCAYEESMRERTPLHEGLTDEDPLLVAYVSDLPPIPNRIGKPDRYGRRDLRDFEPPFIFEHANKVGAKLIVIDCLHAAVEGVNLSDNSSARAVMGNLRTWSHYLGISVLVLHHLTKSSSRGGQPDRFADSAQILATASCFFFLDRHEKGDDESIIVLQGKGRQPVPFSRLELTSKSPLDYQLASSASPVRKRITSVDRVRNLLDEGWILTINEIARRLDLNPITVRIALGRLQEIEQVISGPTETRTRTYRSPP